MAHKWGGKLNFMNLNFSENYVPRIAYGYSKLCNIFFSRSFAKLYPNILSVSLHPGVVKTELTRYMISDTLKLILSPLFLIVGFFMKNPTAGA